MARRRKLPDDLDELKLIKVKEDIANKRALTEKTELQYKIANGELIPVSEVEKTMIVIGELIRTELQGLVESLPAMLEGATAIEAKEILSEKIHETLDKLSNSTF